MHQGIKVRLLNKEMIMVLSALRRYGYLPFLLILFYFAINQIRTRHIGIEHQVLSVLISPMLMLQHAAKVIFNRIVTPFIRQHQLVDHIKELEQENKSLLEQVIKLQSLHLYTNNTQELIDYAQRYQYVVKKLVQVLLTNISMQQHFCLVDAGACHGIETDMVAVYKNCLVGRVTEVYPFYSKVTLITDKNCKIGAYCCQSKVMGIYQGNNDQQGSLLFVSNLHKIVDNDMVISSGQGLIFPQGFGIGTVVDCQAADLCHQIYIKPFINVHELDYCYLIKAGNYSNDVTAVQPNDVSRIESKKQ